MVSIIVTTHNYAHFLAEALLSVKNQTFSDWECIVVDSGSTDNTREIMEKIVSGDNRFKYLYQPNGGVSAARNSGIKISNGEFIQFLDGDDLLQKNKIKAQFTVFKTNPEADIIYSDVLFFDDGNPEVLRTSKTGNKPDSWIPKISGRGKIVLKYLRSYNFFVTHSPLIKRSVIDSCEGFDENMAALEDWDFWLRCATNGFYFMFHSSIDSMVLVRVHKNSLSRKIDLMTNGNFIMLQKSIFNKKSTFENKLFFVLKYSELFWETLFSSKKLPKVSSTMVLISVLLFPAWLIIKFTRLLGIIR